MSANANALTLHGEDFGAVLRAREQEELLRFVAVGSVDDGKSTLIGRLLHDTGAVPEDHVRAARKASRMAGAELDFSLFTDGLQAEREQGITIDVAYRYFSTRKRKFIIADTPGHVQYTRNMVTGASTADVGIILIDARLGVLPQSRRHAYLASLLGIPHLVVCVNKMDLRGYALDVFAEIRDAFATWAGKLAFADVTFVPVSALVGDNVVARSGKTPWYDGPTLLELLESISIERDLSTEPLRFPVQTVIRPDLDYRAFAGEIAAGQVRVGDEIAVLPSGRTSRVTAIDVFEGTLSAASAGQAVSLRLADEIDVSRGDLLVHAGDDRRAPRVARRFDAHLAWLHERPLDPSRAYLLKHTTRTVRARVEAIQHVIDLETLAPTPGHALAVNDVARVTIEAQQPLFVDPYASSRVTGAFIVIDAITNDTVGAGMVIEARGDAADRDGDDVGAAARSLISAAARRARLGHAGAVLQIGGALADARALAEVVEQELFDRGQLPALVDAAEGDRELVARALASAGLIAVVVAPRPIEPPIGVVSARVDAIAGAEPALSADCAIARLAEAFARVSVPPSSPISARR